MDEDFYIEDSNPKKAMLSIIIFLLIIGILIGLFYFHRYKNKVLVRNNIKLELGSEINKDINFYLKKEVKNTDDYDIDFSNLPIVDGKLSEVGKFTIKIKYNNKYKSKKISVVDTTKPEVSVQDLKVGVNEDYDIGDFVTKCEDLSRPCAVYYANDSSAELQKNKGEYKFDIKVCDSYNNCVTTPVKLSVLENYSYESLKENDMTYDHVDDDYSDFNKNIFLRFTHAVNSDEVENGEFGNAFQDMTATDFHEYLSEEDKIYSIASTEIVYVYNKYNYVIGCAIRVKLSNGEYRYLTK